MTCLNIWLELIVKLGEIKHLINVVSFLVFFRVSEVYSMMKSLIFGLIPVIDELSFKIIS